MAKYTIAILFLQILFTICLSEENVSEENNCRIVMDAHDRAFMYSRNFIGGQSNRWPNGIVPYTINSSFSESEIEMIHKSMKHITDKACVKFVERTNETHYVDFFTGGLTCYASLGYNPYRKRGYVHLRTPYCVVLGTVVHELLHVLGFAHEHTRPDRDEYVKIHWENLIDDNIYHNYWRALGVNEPATIPSCKTVGIDQYDNCYGGFRTATFGVNYDYESIMHYSLTSNTKNNKKTMTLKKPTKIIIPNRDGMSYLDTAKLNLAYKCPGAYIPKSTPTPTTTCKDIFGCCQYYLNHCGNNDFVNRNCKKTCFNCLCENHFEDKVCSKLSKHCGHQFVKDFCKKSCEQC